MDLQSNPVNEILYASFNQDFTCFVCGTESGFRVYATDPFRLTHRRDFENGGLGVVAMLFRTNILAFAGGGRSPRVQPHKIVLWDDREARVIAELSFRSAVKSVRLRRDLIVAVLNSKVFVYGFRTLSLLDTIETTGNPKGLCCLSVGSDRVVLVCPGIQQGWALVVLYPAHVGDMHAPVARERTMNIPAHESAIAAMAIDYDGTLLATASDKGTIVRVYDNTSEVQVQELRRGADRAEIHSLAFSPSGDFLAVSSDKGTVHIFAVKRPASDIPPAAGSNAKSSLQRISSVLPSYFSSEWSLAQFRVPDYRCIAAFGRDPNTVIVVCANGSYYKARFDPTRGGEMVREDFRRFDAASEAAADTGDGAALEADEPADPTPEPTPAANQEAAQAADVAMDADAPAAAVGRPAGSA